MKFSTVIIAAAVLSGCAGRQQMDTLTAQMAELNRRTELLVRENAELRRSLLAQKQAPSAFQPAVPAPQPVRAMPAPVRRPSRAVASMFPRQEQGFLYAPHPNCASGPYRLAVRNKSSYYIRLMVNGRPVMNYGGRGPLPHLPPGQELNICLDRLGENNISGIAYAVHRGVLAKVKTFSRQERFRPRARGHRFTLDNARIGRW